MRIGTWNIGHRASQRVIKPGTVGAIEALAADVLVLTEFVPRPSRAGFLASLRALGYRDLILSETTCRARCNYVLVASRLQATRGDLVVPQDIEEQFPSNVLHVRLTAGLDVLGVRIPDYSDRRPLRHACWDWIESAASHLSTRRAVLLGDFNSDPSYPAKNCGDRFQQLAGAGWHHALPETGASYWTPQGAAKRLDHAFASAGARVNRAEYVVRAGAVQLAGKRGLSDHAALVVDLAE